MIRIFEGFAIPLLASTLIACATTRSAPPTDRPSEPESEETLISTKRLGSFLPASVAGFERLSSTSLLHHEVDATEVIGRYGSARGGGLTIALADLRKQPRMYQNFLTGGGIHQTSSGNPFGLEFSQSSLQGSESYGLLLGQASQASFGQASGVLGMAQSSQATLFSVESQVSPQASPEQVSQASVLFSQPSPGSQSTFSTGQVSMSPAQVSAQLQRSGVDFEQLSQVSQESPAFSLSQSSAEDGSYIRPYAVDSGYDVAGWELYDANRKVGTLLLGVADRVGIVIEATNVTDPKNLLGIARSLDYREIERAANSG